MTHNDIYTKFLIEYDKANVTSSYPSLTPYEVATILDRAYQALIARKLTGNNPRRSTFESDTKSIEDLRPLVVTDSVSSSSATGTAENEFVYSLPNKLLYFLESDVEYGSSANAADGKSHVREVVDLVSHQIAKNFTATSVNMPWISRPVAFIEDDKIHILVDSYKHPSGPSTAYVTYIKLFNKFAGSSSTGESSGSSSSSTNSPLFGYDDTEYAAPSITTNNIELTSASVSYRFTCSTTVPGCTLYWVKSNSNTTLSNGVLSRIIGSGPRQSVSTSTLNSYSATFPKSDTEYYAQYVVSDSNGNYIAHSPVLPISEATSTPDSGSESGSGSDSGSGSGSSDSSSGKVTFDFENPESLNIPGFQMSDLENGGSIMLTGKTLTNGPVAITFTTHNENFDISQMQKWYLTTYEGLICAEYNHNCAFYVRVSSQYKLTRIRIKGALVFDPVQYNGLSSGDGHSNFINPFNGVVWYPDPGQTLSIVKLSENQVNAYKQWAYFIEVMYEPK